MGTPKGAADSPGAEQEPKALRSSSLAYGESRAERGAGPVSRCPPEPRPGARRGSLAPSRPAPSAPGAGGRGRAGEDAPREGDSQLMVMPSSTPRLLGSFTWKVPLLGMTDSGCKQRWTRVRARPHLPVQSSWEGPAPSCSLHPSEAKTDRLGHDNQSTRSEGRLGLESTSRLGSKPGPVRIQG